jgi:aspartyl-tRNA(Asn)/glutamyl-tRNA(Gln) amidotransferase subunit C
VSAEDHSADPVPRARPAALGSEDVRHLGHLARLELSDDEVTLFASQLDIILSAVARVGEVAAQDVPPTSHAVPMVNVLRPDVITPSLSLEAALSGAPSVEDDKFRVPQILGEES